MGDKLLDSSDKIADSDKNKDSAQDKWQQELAQERDSQRTRDTGNVKPAERQSSITFDDDSEKNPTKIRTANGDTITIQYDSDHKIIGYSWRDKSGVYSHSETTTDGHFSGEVMPYGPFGPNVTHADVQADGTFTLTYSDGSKVTETIDGQETRTDKDGKTTVVTPGNTYKVSESLDIDKYTRHFDDGTTWTETNDGKITITDKDGNVIPPPASNIDKRPASIVEP